MNGKKIIDGIFSERVEEISNEEKAIMKSISIGNIIAVCISWSVNKSILWAFLHGIFSWFYVIYYAIIR